MGGRMRLGAYALCLQAERVLLTQLWDGDPAAGCWTLPGGGVHWGEDPAEAVLRELYEEAGLEGSVQDLLAVRSEVLPPWREHGELHVIQIVYRVNAEGEPRVIEEERSTVDVAWFQLDEVGSLPRVDLVDHALKEAGR